MDGFPGHKKQYLTRVLHLAYSKTETFEIHLSKCAQDIQVLARRGASERSSSVESVLHPGRQQ